VCDSSPSSGAYTREGGERNVRSVSAEGEQLRRSVDEFAAAGANGAVPLAGALESLAAAIRTDLRAGEATKALRSAASRLRQGADETVAAKEVKAALATTVSAFRETPVVLTIGDGGGATSFFACAIDLVDGSASLRSQRASLICVLRAATNVVFAIEGMPPPFQASSLVGPRSGRPMGFAGAVAKARNAVAKLRTIGVDGRREAASQSFEAFAAALAALQGSSVLSGGEGAVSELRMQACRLRGATFLTFDKADWLKAGLTAALAGIETVAARGTRGWLESWFHTAHAAVEDLRGDVAWSFQNAAVQDAFRSVLDVYLRYGDRLAADARRGAAGRGAAPRPNVTHSRGGGGRANQGRREKSGIADALILSAMPATTAPTKPSTRPLKVFLAEDDIALRSTIALLLEKDGHQVRQARDGIDLMVDLASEESPRKDLLVVTDMRMPMIGGLAIVRSLARERRCPPFLLMTAFATPDVRAEAERLGALALLDKPFDLDELRRVVRWVSDTRGKR
jgi:two-component system response regulator (stage 0 sporulation protein F)